MNLWLDCPLRANVSRLLHKKDAWELCQNFPVRFNYGKETILSFTIKRGFVFDFASVPWLLRGFFPRVGQKTDGPALIHDALYLTELVDRKTADDLFLFAMRDEFAVNRFKADLMHAGVRAGGWYVWNKHTEESIREARKQLDNIFIDIPKLSKALDEWRHW